MFTVYIIMHLSFQNRTAVPNIIITFIINDYLISDFAFTTVSGLFEYAHALMRFNIWEQMCL